MGPAEEKLYPVIDALLEDWRATGDRAVPHTKVIGHRWNERSWEVRQFLARNQHSFRSFMGRRAQGPPAARRRRVGRLCAAGGDHRAGPHPGGAQRRRTGRHARAVDHAAAGDVRAGRHRGGPAGLAAAVYGASEGLKTVPDRGGHHRRAGRAQLRIENYLGFPTGISGAELTTSARRQAERFGAEVITTRKAVRLHAGDTGSARTIEFEDGSTVGAQAVILATGVDYRQLRVTGCWDNP